MEKTIQLYCNVDDEGNIIQSFFGENIIPSEAFTFFFMIDEETVENIEDYKVGIERFRPVLILK